MEGNLDRTVAEQSSPLRRGAAKRRGGLSPEASAKGGLSRVTNNKSRLTNAHRPAQTKFAWVESEGAHVVRRGVGTSNK